jgi:hypothetical protein
VGELNIGRVINRLHQADDHVELLVLDRQLFSKESESLKPIDQSGTKFSFDDLATSVKPVSGDAAFGFSDLAKSVRAIDPWKVSPDEFKKEVKKLEKRKLALAEMLPDAY